MKLLIDNYHGVGKLEVLTENTESGRSIYLEGPMVMCNVPNRNERVYDLETVGKPSVEAYNKNYIGERRAIGEIEHPEYPFPKLVEAATMVKEPLTWVGSNAVGKALVLNNKNGAILRSLIEADFNLGVSTRGLGKVRKKGNSDHVVPGYMITAIDTVDRPSGQVCYVNAVNEAVEWENRNGVWVPVGVDGRIVDTLIKEHETQEAEFARRFKLVLSKL